MKKNKLHTENDDYKLIVKSKHILFYFIKISEKKK